MTAADLGDDGEEGEASGDTTYRPLYPTFGPN